MVDLREVRKESEIIIYIRIQMRKETKMTIETRSGYD
jgi:hypothetical protein